MTKMVKSVARTQRLVRAETRKKLCLFFIVSVYSSRKYEDVPENERTSQQYEALNTGMYEIKVLYLA